MPHFLVGYSFGTVDLGIIVTQMRRYVSSHGGFRFTMRKYYFGLSSRSDLPDVLANSFLDKNEFDRWFQSIYLSAERSGKEKVLIIQIVPFTFVLYSIY